MSSTKQVISSAESTGTVGAFLKKERLSRHISLEEMAEATGIQITKLQALEGDDRDNLPAEAFVRGFIKIYTKHLNIDVGEALNLYKQKGEDRLSEAKEIFSTKEFLGGKPFTKSLTIITKKHIALVIFIIIFGMIVYRVYDYFF